MNTLNELNAAVLLPHPPQAIKCACCEQPKTTLSNKVATCMCFPIIIDQTDPLLKVPGPIASQMKTWRSWQSIKRTDQHFHGKQKIFNNQHQDLVSLFV